jgi:hypothetical protein
MLKYVLFKASTDENIKGALFPRVKLQLNHFKTVKYIQNWSGIAINT